MIAALDRVHGLFHPGYTRHIVKVTTRIFAALLFSLIALVGFSLGGTWVQGHNINALDAADSQSNSTVADHTASLEKTQRLRIWTTGAQGFCLLLCGALCVLGLRLRNQAARESLVKEAAERALDAERCAAEKRVEDRTRELRQEVNERRRTDKLNRGQRQVLEMLASPEQLKTEDILRHLAETVAAQHEGWKCSLHLAKCGGKALQLAASSDINEQPGRYIDGVGSGLQDAPECMACASGRTYIADQLTETGRPWSQALVASGILSAWSVPFRANESGEVAGTLTVYSSLPDRPTRREMEIVETAARLAALVFEHRRIHAELVQNAYQDALTGLPNRLAGEQAIESAIQQASQCGESVAVMRIDVNRLKRINDQHGHDAGNLVLTAVAERLRRLTATAGSVARMGEDEFLVVIPGPADSIDSIEIARRLGTAIAKPIYAGSALVSVSASIGICVYPQDGATVNALERNADFAMYRAKDSGAGYCVFSLAMSEEAREALEIEEALGVAIEKDYLHLFYQPLYSQGGELTGFEALLRFEHPRLGNISPARFIRIAEETRLIVPIGNWVLREACRQLQTWHEAGHRRVHMAVNISALQFARDDFADTVARIFSDCNLAPEHLILELTESVVMEDYETVVRQMTLLKQCGVRIAMDDFGTGYSSLSYLHRIPIDVLKIDRSFIERLADPEGTRPIVEAVIAMARHLGLQVVAEGVETTEQQDILQQAGCHSYQGYLFARPLPPEEAENCLAASRNTPFANPQLFRLVSQAVA